MKSTPISEKPIMTYRSLCVLLSGLALCLTFLDIEARATNITEPVTFAGPPQDFGLDLSFAGTLFVSGTGTVRDVVAGRDADFVINSAVPLGLNPDTVHLVSDPAGTATVGFDNVNLNNKTLSDLDVDFRNGAAWNFGLDPIDILVTIQDVAFGTDVDFDLRFETNASINQFAFLQDPGPTPAGPIYSAPGTLSAGIVGSITGKVLDIVGGLDVDLGEVSSINSSTSDDTDLPGLMTLTPLGGITPQDLLTELDLNLPFSVPIPISESGVVNQDDSDLLLNLNFSLGGTLTLSNLNYHLEDTLPGVVVPEPGGLLLGGLGMLTLAAYGWRRKKRTAK